MVVIVTIPIDDQRPAQCSGPPKHPRWVEDRDGIVGQTNSQRVATDSPKPMLMINRIKGQANFPTVRSQFCDEKK